MRFPFVSRERFDDERARCLKLEHEVERLRELLSPALRATPPPPEIRTVEKITLTEGTDFATIMPAGRPTLAHITSEANKAALERAKTPGAAGIAHELAEFAAKRPVLTRSAPKAVNGD